MQRAGEEVQLQGKETPQVRCAVGRKKRKSDDLLLDKVVPQIVTSDEESMTKVQKLLLKFDSKKNNEFKFGNRKTIPHCGDTSSSSNVFIVRKQLAQNPARKEEDDREEDAQGTGARKQEDGDHGPKTLAEARTLFTSNLNPKIQAKKLQSQHLEPTPGQLQPSVEIFCDLPMGKTEADDITA